MIRGRRSRSAAVAVMCLLGVASSAAGQRHPGRGEVGWVGLYNAVLVEWLENENRLSELCAPAAAGTAAWRACRDERMTPKAQRITLRRAPRENAAPEGTLVVVATPGQGLRASYQPAGGGPATAFAPDLFDADWGYGPYFHQTFLERRGTWFLLPAGPFPAPAWIDAREFTSEPDVRLLAAGEVVTTPGGDLVVLGVEHGVLRARPEQEADMWCEAGDPPPLAPAKEARIPVEALYGPTGHLLVGIKYTRGC